MNAPERDGQVPAAQADRGAPASVIDVPMEQWAAVALTVRAVGGVAARQIARAYLVPEATMAQRISRAKRTVWRLLGAARRA